MLLQFTPASISPRRRLVHVKKRSDNQRQVELEESASIQAVGGKSNRIRWHERTKASTRAQHPKTFCIKTTCVRPHQRPTSAPCPFSGATQKLVSARRMPYRGGGSGGGAVPESDFGTWPSVSPCSTAFRQRTLGGRAPCGCLGGWQRIRRRLRGLSEGRRFRCRTWTRRVAWRSLRRRSSSGAITAVREWKGRRGVWPHYAADKAPEVRCATGPNLDYVVNVDTERARRDSDVSYRGGVCRHFLHFYMTKYTAAHRV